MQEFLHELQTLARLISMRTEVQIELTERTNPGWRFNWRTGVIGVDPVDIDLQDKDFCRGLLLHEAAHATITRYTGIIPTSLLANAGIMELLNVIEDARLENWLQARHPGCTEWIRQYNNALYGGNLKVNADLYKESVLTPFLMGLLMRWWYDCLPDYWNPLARDAIEQVWEPFCQVISLYPSITMPALMKEAEAYENHPVACSYRGPTGKSERGLTEAVARMTQYDGWLIIRNSIIPVFEELCRRSGESVASAMIERKGVFFIGAPEAETSGESTRSGHDGSRREPVDRNDPIESTNAEVAYGRIVASHAVEMDAVADVLLRHLMANVRPKTTRFLPSGPILDLSVAIQFEADPRRYNQLWQRRTLPTRPDPHFIVLLDLSSSMRGHRIEAAQVAAILLREVCERCGIALSLISFASNAKCLLRWNQFHSQREVKINLGAMPGLVAGSTDLAEGLRWASEQLRDSPHQERFLWIISDGQPNDAPTAKELLARLRPDLTAAYGLGMGHGTDALRQLLPTSVTGLSPHQLPEAVGMLLQQNTINGK